MILDEVSFPRLCDRKDWQLCQSFSIETLIILKSVFVHFYRPISCASLVANIVLNCVDACIKADSIMLHNNLLLDKSVDLLFQEVALIDIIGLQLLVVFLQVGDVFNDLLENVIGGFCGMMLKCGALASQKLDFLLVVIE